MIADDFQNECERIWAGCTHKTWVVEVGHRGKSRIMYVRAKTKERAEAAAKFYGLFPKAAHASARLAHPTWDLGCSERTEEPACHNAE